jgi:hypothetical protein
LFDDLGSVARQRGAEVDRAVFEVNVSGDAKVVVEEEPDDEAVIDEAIIGTISSMPIMASGKHSKGVVEPCTTAHDALLI